MLELAHLYLISLIFALGVLLLLASKSNKTLGDALLMVFIGLLTINYASMYGIQQSPDQTRWLAEISDASLFLYGPLMWWYTLSYTELDFRLSFVYLGHGFPFMLAVAILERPILAGTAIDSADRVVLMVLKMLSVGLYLLMVLRSLQRYQRRLKQFFSATEKLQLDWLYFLTLCSLGLWLLAVVSLGLFYGFGVNIPFHGGLYANIGSSLFIFVIGGYGFRQKQVFAPIEVFRSVDIQDTTNQQELPKYRNSGLKETEEAAAHTRLLAFMQETQPYLDQELTLFKLAEATHLSPNHLSQIINSREQVNFFDFVNRYRVEQVKGVMSSPQFQHLTLLGMAMEAGFKSKASFNRAFKKFTGQTPSEYRKSLDQSG
ncbi:MAG: helix-turn-helix domain-containing protein [Bacteroidota bacterium]